MKHYRAIALTCLAAFCLLPATLASADKPEEDAPPAAEVEGTMLLEDFNDLEKAAERWRTVNDNVMGGRSKGGPSFADGLLTFQGATNTNGGGFSSLRTKPDPIDLSETTGLLLRVKGDGRTYKAALRTDASIRRSRIPFRADFPTVKDEWTTVFVPFKNMTPSFRGFPLKNPPALELDKVEAMGLMIYDKKDGPFKLQVDWIKAVPEAPEGAVIAGEPKDREEPI
jgi:hypothetical protein